MGNCAVSVAHFAILRNPQEAVACSGVHPSLSPRFTSAPCFTRNSTMSKLSSMHACKEGSNEGEGEEREANK